MYFHPGFALRHEGGEAEAWVTFFDSPVPVRLALVPDETYYCLRIKDGESFLARAAKASSMTIRYQPLRAEKPFEVEFPLGPMPKALARFEEMAKQGSAS